jgi:tetratricopeptide (TPR) repeat protein
MMTIRRSALFSFFAGVVLLAALSGCSGGNPYMSKAEDAMEDERYEDALASVDSALVVDSANADAYLMKADLLREMADSTMAPDEYKSLYRQAREVEEKAIQYRPGARSEVENRRRLAYADQSQQGAKAFQRGRRNSDPVAYRKAAAHFGAASATYPDSAGVVLNEAYARLNRAQNMEEGSMTDAIPVLERYLELTDEPSKNAYDILSALYLQEGQTENAIDLLESAREDLSTRPTLFKVGGSRGLSYSGTVQDGGNTREVSGTVPGRVRIEAESGTVSGSFTKEQKKGQLRVQLLYRGTTVADTTISTGQARLTTNLDEQAPLAQIEGRLLNAYNQAGDTEKAMEAYREQIEENPNNVTYRYNYGSLLLQDDQFDAAIEQLQKAVELEPGNVKAQYNLGAAYSNKARLLQDSLTTLNDSMQTISQEAMEENREPTAEEKQMVNELDQQTKTLTERKQGLFEKAIPPLERARQLSGQDGSFRQDACRALVTAYVQTERVEQAKQYEECAGLQVEQQGGGN